MYKEPSLHELEEKLLKTSRSPTMDSKDGGQSLEHKEQQEEEDCTEQEGS